MKDFCLKDKIWHPVWHPKGFIEVEDFKEFIKILKSDFKKTLEFYEMKIIYNKQEIILRGHEKRYLIEEMINNRAGDL